jgi:hypothetical protein
LKGDKIILGDNKTWKGVFVSADWKIPRLTYCNSVTLKDPRIFH